MQTGRVLTGFGDTAGLLLSHMYSREGRDKEKGEGGREEGERREGGREGGGGGERGRGGGGGGGRGGGEGGGLEEGGREEEGEVERGGQGDRKCTRTNPSYVRKYRTPFAVCKTI